jgi:hypothetical protein
LIEKALGHECSDIAHHVTERGVEKHPADGLMKQLRRREGADDEEGTKKAGY